MRIFFLHDYPVIKSGYDLAKLLPEIETLAEAKKAKAKLIRRLSKGNRKSRRLAKKLRRCKKRHRCWSDMCQVCKRLFGRWYGAQVIPLFEGQDILLVTLVPEKNSRPPGELNLLEPLKMKGALSKKFALPGLEKAIVIGGIDISFNVHSDNAWTPRWQPHFHLIVAGISKKDLWAVLRPRYKKSIEIPRPTHSKSVTDLPEAVSYTFKSFFCRRVSYIDENGEKQARSVSLKVHEMEEAAVFGDTIKITDRLFLRNVRHYGKRLVITSKNSSRNTAQGRKYRFRGHKKGKE
ncbi:MAG: hypothetical protein COB46_03580 [Rhodospirillaceae bacterium]|nr:MAG: hypothetical protein COB46_03580 [Rhodospirillaceae bacterium]